MNDNIYQALTRRFNAGRLRAILSSGQAVVMHRLAVMSKDGDWILREDSDTIGHVLAELEARGAKYRFGAPLDVRWLAGGWSSHFEFRADKLRVRTDFVTRPPRIEPDALAALWASSAASSDDIPFVNVLTLAELKKTNRERDYAVIGELARLAKDPVEQLLLSRSARDLMSLAREHPDLLEEAAEQRPVLRDVNKGRNALETALDAERRELMHANERRLEVYMTAAARWNDAWPALSERVSGRPFPEAHRLIVESAEDLLPFTVETPTQ